MDIVHLSVYEHQANIAAREYAQEHCEHIKRVMYSNSNKIIWTDDENVHYFMGSTSYFQWSKGRTYMLSDGTMMHSGYPMNFYKEEKNDI